MVSAQSPKRLKEEAVVFWMVGLPMGVLCGSTHRIAAVYTDDASEYANNVKIVG